MENNTTPHRPTHRAYAVTKHGERKFWREIGAVGLTATARASA